MIQKTWIQKFAQYGFTFVPVPDWDDRQFTHNNGYFKGSSAIGSSSYHGITIDRKRNMIKFTSSIGKDELGDLVMDSTYYYLENKYIESFESYLSSRWNN